MRLTPLTQAKLKETCDASWLGNLGGGEKCEMLAGLGPLVEVSLPPRFEDGPASEILQLKIGAGFGAHGWRAEYLTTKLGRERRGAKAGLM